MNGFLILFVFMELNSISFPYKGTTNVRSDNVMTLDQVIVTSPPVVQALMASWNHIRRNFGRYISRQGNLNMPYKAGYYGDKFWVKSIRIQIYLSHYHTLANSETYWAAAFDKIRMIASLSNFDVKLKITVHLGLDSVKSPVKRLLGPWSVYWRKVGVPFKSCGGVSLV